MAADSVSSSSTRIVPLPAPVDLSSITSVLISALVAPRDCVANGLDASSVPERAGAAGSPNAAIAAARDPVSLVNYIISDE
jgi:hypothetical protein